MKYFRQVYLSAASIILLSNLLAACSRGAFMSEKAFVVPERVKLKSSMAPASRVVGELKSGDQVTVTNRLNSEDGTQWSKVNGPDGEEGWIESSYLVKQAIVEQSRKIAEEIRDIPTQAVGRSKARLRLRLSPDRTNEENTATQLPSGTVLEIVARERKPRPASLDNRAETAPDADDSKVRYDDWYKVRLKDYAVLPAGWIYGGSVELDVPPEIVYFVSAGRRITGWQKIGTLTGDDSRSGDHYLVLERKVFGTDEAVDFDRVKVLAYDPFSRNYSTPFREDVQGRFPVTLKMAGTRGGFQLIVIDKDKREQRLDYGIEMLEAGRVKVTKPARK
jgi:hypothetical protein